MTSSNSNNSNSNSTNNSNKNQSSGKQNASASNSQSDNTSNRGFASMDPERQREIASEGGKAAHASGNAHEFTSEEAREAGRQSHKNDTTQGQGIAQARSNQSDKNSADSSSSNRTTTGQRGGSSEQHAEAGRQSHKNS